MRSMLGRPSSWKKTSGRSKRKSRNSTVPFQKTKAARRRYEARGWYLQYVTISTASFSPITEHNTNCSSIIITSPCRNPFICLGGRWWLRREFTLSTPRRPFKSAFFYWWPWSVACFFSWGPTTFPCPSGSSISAAAFYRWTNVAIFAFHSIMRPFSNTTSTSPHSLPPFQLSPISGLRTTS